MNLDLCKKLKLLEQVSSNDGTIKDKIIESINNNSVEIVSFESINTWKNIEKEDLNKGYVWSSYEDCRSFTFKIKNEKLVCDIIIYDMDISCKMKSRRFITTMSFDLSFIDNITWLITHNFQKYMDHKYEEHLNDEKDKWIIMQTQILLKE